MPEPLTFLPVGAHDILVELADLSTTLTLLDQIVAEKWPEITDLVPAARTLMVCFDPLLGDRETLMRRIAALDLTQKSRRSGSELMLPVLYDGEDLGDVAAHLGLTREELITRHTAATYTVAFSGFAPGFAYMTCDDPLFQVPRRASPRVRIPAGAVALGGSFSGIYPTDSPGGWQIIGRTPVKMWDEAREKPALLAPGGQVRFRAISPEDFAAWPQGDIQIAPERRRDLTVLRSDFPAFYQDLGREGMAGQGIPCSGAMDRASLIAANRSVGNDRNAAVIEITSGGFSARAERALTLAVTGADGELSLDTARGEKLRPAYGQAIALDAGDVLSIAHAKSGARAYLALRGGFVAEEVLGSVARDTLAKVGPAPVKAGDALEMGDAPVRAVADYAAKATALPVRDEVVTLNVHLGPRTDWFSETGLQTFLTQEWEVSQEADRVGIRLRGETAIDFAMTGELPSEATVLGALQVPRSGHPVLFLADHPLTGGYPVIAVVAADQLDLAGQIPIGARLRFRAISGFNPISRDRLK
jgi:KipI family sensor histidine kinase inhibitor